jgi:hypothetical protein
MNIFRYIIRKGYDDTMESIEETRKCVFDQFPEYQIKMLLTDLIAKAGKEDTFKLSMEMRIYKKIVMIMELG